MDREASGAQSFGEPDTLESADPGRRVRASVPLPAVKRVAHPPTRTVADDLSAIGAAVLWVEETLAAAGVEESICGHVQVCVEEHLANLITHGELLGATRGIAIKVDVRPEAAEVTISDRCAPFDPTAASPTAWSLESAAGNGMRLIRGFASELQYASLPDGNAFSMSFARPLPAAEALRAIPALSRLPAAALARLAVAARPRKAVDGEVLMRQGEPSHHALALLEGALDAIDESKHGSASVGHVDAPALVGEIGAFAGLPRTATLIARGPVTALEIPREALLAAAEADPGLMTAVIANLGRQIQNLNHAVALYAGGLEALERGELDIPLIEELTHPTPELAAFGRAFEQLARRIASDRRKRPRLPSA